MWIARVETETAGTRTVARAATAVEAGLKARKWFAKNSWAVRGATLTLVAEGPNPYVERMGKAA